MSSHLPSDVEMLTIGEECLRRIRPCDFDIAGRAGFQANPKRRNAAMNIPEIVIAPVDSPLSNADVTLTH